MYKEYQYGVTVIGFFEAAGNKICLSLSQYIEGEHGNKTCIYLY